MIKAKPLFLFSRRSTPYWDADDKALNRGKRREEPLITRTTPGWACPQGRGDLPNSCLKLIQPFMGITCNSCGSGQAQEMSSHSHFAASFPFLSPVFSLWQRSSSSQTLYFAVTMQYIRTTVVSVNGLSVPLSCLQQWTSLATRPWAGWLLTSYSQYHDWLSDFNSFLDNTQGNGFTILKCGI